MQSVSNQSFTRRRIQCRQLDIYGITMCKHYCIILVFYLEGRGLLEQRLSSLYSLDNVTGATTRRIFPGKHRRTRSNKPTTLHLTTFTRDDCMPSLCCLCTCLTCRPWLQILSSRSHKLAMSVFSSTPVMLTSPWPSSTASRPIFSTSMRLV